MAIETQRPEREDEHRADDAGESPTSGNTVQLDAQEEREVKKRIAPRAAVVFETVRREGESELNRPAVALAFSGLAAGLSMGFSLAATALLRAHLPDAPWRPLVANLGYTVGFLIVVLGRQQLFTENTVTVILPLLDDREKMKVFIKVVRLWSIVLAANLIGAACFAFAAADTSAFPPALRNAMHELSVEAGSLSFASVVARGVVAGWLIALMVWLLPAAANNRVGVIAIITYIVGAMGLTHIIAGSVDVLYGVADGIRSWSDYGVGFLLPVFLGNVVGGVALVSLLNYGQVAPETE